MPEFSDSKIVEYLNPDLTGTSLAVLAVYLFTTDWLEWDPPVLRAELTELLGRPVEDETCDKLQAITLLITTDRFTTSLSAFLPVTRALSGEVVDDSYFLPSELESLVKGCTEAGLHIGRLNNLHPDVKRYVGVILDRHGLYTPPSVIDFAEYPPDSHEDSMKIRGSEEITDKQFWMDQRNMQTILENAGLGHIRKILAEVKSFPPIIERQEVDRLDKVVEEMAGQPQAEQ